MRVLVLSVTAGQGHNSCAKAAIAALETRGATCRLLDTLGFLNDLLGSGVDKGYLLMGKLSPAAFGALYDASVQSAQKRRAFNLSELMTEGMAKKMAGYIADFAPDCILCTHVFAALILTQLHKKGLCSVRTIGVNTDFSLHPLWAHAELDHMVLACDLMEYPALQAGFEKEQLRFFGIPVGPQFAGGGSAKEARAALGMPEKPTVTVMSGSMGFGHLANHIVELDGLPQDFQMVVVCGNNKEAYDEIAAMQEQGCFAHGVFCHGYVDNAHQLMRAGDVVVTKPGGLSTTECLHLGRPMVLMEPIPGLEEYNAAFLANCGAAAWATEHYPLAQAVYGLLQSEAWRQNMLAAQKGIHPGVAAELLAGFVLRT